MNESTRKGMAIAAAAAGLFLGATAITAVAAEEAKIHCTGVNGCKGQSDCSTASNSCKGQNACKGQGFVELTEKQCEDAKAKMKK